ncbi:hypothetical protein NMY22_g19282 [Coprinellus aureogranulatus]|nr:hypothetical protein NMY22_g19282 [Coprinellus aureogranulatus]
MKINMQDDENNIEGSQRMEGIGDNPDEPMDSEDTGSGEVPNFAGVVAETDSQRANEESVGLLLLVQPLDEDTYVDDLEGAECETSSLALELLNILAIGIAALMSISIVICWRFGVVEVETAWLVTTSRGPTRWTITVFKIGRLSFEYALRSP